jgi:hypothetical protein
MVRYEEGGSEEVRRGPYYLVYANSADELERKVNELLDEWPEWTFLGFWQVGKTLYREMLKRPVPGLDQMLVMPAAADSPMQ